ncbi:MAG: TRAP transporter substrate-binding protein [Bariatricus sp.]
MKKVLSMGLALTMAIGLTACSGGNTASTAAAAKTEASKAESAEETEAQKKEEVKEEKNADTKELKVSHVFAESHPVHQAFLKASDELYEKSGGRYKLTIYPNGTYGNYSDSITACQMGTLDIACLDSASDWLESAGVLFAPYCFDSYEHWQKFKDSDLCTEMREEISKAVGGVKQLNMYNFGFRNLTANKEIRTLDDFDGLTLRCVNFEPYSTLKDVFDVAITSIPIEDVYMSLQTGVADCEENPVTQIVTMKFYEVQDYLIMTRHMLACSSTIINQNLWDSLSDEDKAVFEEVFTNMGNNVDQMTVENESALIDECVSNGMTLIDDVDTAPFKENAKKVVDNYPAWQDWYNQIQTMK